MVYEPCPVIRQAALDAYPKIPGLLASAFAALDGPTLRSLNAKVAVDGMDVDTVAGGWLKQKQLLK
jgi:osmoprotectant transport system substrate-binding protein